MKIYTHGGTFHADDVFSVALLRALDHEVTVTRVFKVSDVMIEEAANGSAMIIDIGGQYVPSKGMFDHHQANAPYRANGGKFASFGQLVNVLGHEGDMETFWFRAVDELAAQVDATDNGEDVGCHCAFSLAVNAMNPAWDEDGSPAAMDAAFSKAVDWAEALLRRIISREDSACRAEHLVRKAPVEGGVKILPQYAPWQDFIAGDKGVKAVVWPSNRGGFNCQINPTAPGSFDRVGDFSNVAAGTNGCTFVHAAGFLAAFETEEAAIAAGKAVVLR